MSTPRFLDLLSNFAVLTPDRPAVVDTTGEVWSYLALVDRIARLRKDLENFGIGPGDMVALAMPDGPDMTLAFLAVSSDLAAAPVNPRYKAAEFRFHLADLRPRAILIRSQDEERLAELRAVAGALGVPILAMRTGQGGSPPRIAALGGWNDGSAARRLDPSIALVLHTSGTVGRPKMVPISRANIVDSARQIAAALRLTAADRALAVMPLFHIHGIMVSVHAPLAVGGCVIATPGFSASGFFAWIADLTPTWYSAVPTMHQTILDTAPAHTEAVARSRLRLVRSSSSSLPAAVMARLEALFRAPVIEGYGMTEATQQITSNPLPPGTRKPGSVGLPAGPDVRILDPNGDECARGTKGEVAIRGPNVVNGYLDADAEAAAAFRDGWFHTGDEGFLDEDGYLTITGRLKETINRAGEKVAPREVEEVLLSHPAVAQAAVFGVPHPKLGEAVYAAVVLRTADGASEVELRQLVAEQLARFKVPARVLIRDTIPKGPTGKVQRLLLPRQLADEIALLPLPDSAQDMGRLVLKGLATLSTVSLDDPTLIASLDTSNGDASFDELGFDSLAAMELCIFIEEHTGLQIAEEDIERHPTVRALAQHLHHLLG